MPIYMDRHIVPGITLKDATEAHNLDVAIQDEYNCKAITFWLDEERGCAFCLIEAPHKQAVRDLHNNAHGLMPHEIIEVDDNLVFSFLGRISDPEPTGESGNESVLLYDSAYRAIMNVHICEAALITSRHGHQKAKEVFKAYREIVDQACAEYYGREVDGSSDSFIVSFSGVGDAINCAAEIYQLVEEFNQNTAYPNRVAIGISGGDPVTEKKDLFEEVTQLSQRLCYLSAGRDNIMVSSEIMEKLGSGQLMKYSEFRYVTFLGPAEEHFFNRLMETIEGTWQHSQLTLGAICKKMGMSRSQLYRKITSITGQSFVDFLREFRLKKALQLIKKNQDNITQVVYTTGFNNPSYFSKCFKERFGMLPSEFAKNVR